MGKVPVHFRSRKPRLPLKHARRADVLADRFEGLAGPIDTQHMLISLLLPPAAKQFMQDLDLDREVEQLCGSRYSRGQANSRWGSQEGSVIIANHHVAIELPRVRSKDGREVKLQTPSASRKARFQSAGSERRRKRSKNCKPGFFARWMCVRCSSMANAFANMASSSHLTWPLTVAGLCSASTKRIPRTPLPVLSF